MSTRHQPSVYVLAANLRHNDHESSGANVRTLSTHITSSDDLKACLLSRIHIIWDKFGLHDFLLDWMSSLLYSQRVSEMWFG
jgi:hypothetical protein